MRFIEVQIQNFLSFGAIQTVPLDRRGLLAVFGQNQDSKGADSNGAGKSTIPEAMVWALYGETMRGYKGDDVINRAVGKECLVRLVVEEDNGTRYVIERTRKASAKKPADLRLYVSGVDRTGGTNADTQDAVLTLVGMDFSTFTQAVMLSHGARPFSQMADKEQKDVLEDIMRTATLTKAQGRTKERVVQQQNQLAEVRTTLASTGTKLFDAEIRLSKLVQQQAQHATLIEQRRLELTKRRVDLEMRLDEIYARTGLDALLALKEHQETQLRVLEQDLASFREKELRITQRHGLKRSEIARDEGIAIGRLRQIGQDLTMVDRLVGKVCHTCKQVLTPQAAEACMEEWVQEKAALETKLREATKLRAREDVAEKKAIGKLTGDRQVMEQAVSEMRALLQGVISDIHKRSADLQAICDLEQQIFHHDEEIAALDATDNPYQALIDQTQAEGARYKHEQRGLEAREHVLDIQVRHLVFVAQAFGNQGLKSYVLDTVVPTLTERAQHYLDILSGGDITIRFSTQTQLKSGVLKDQFQVEAVNRFGADVYQGNSEGEKRRVDLAVGWALGDLAATRAHKPIRFKGLDEPFTNLDETGEDAVIRLLHTVVSQYETIMCITHSAHLQSQFQNQLLVVKQNGVSRVE
jgi:DNA repair exonuclease SbcCD ATPase subunit